MGGRPRDLTEDQQKATRDLVLRAVSEMGTERVEAELGITRRTLDRWRKGDGVSLKNAEALHKMMRGTLEKSGLHAGPNGRVVADERNGSLQGVSLAIRLLMAREEAGFLFPNLAAAVRFDEGQAPAERRAWSKAAIVAAAGGAMGDEDLTTGEWCRALDAIESALAGVRKELAKPAPPVPKKLRP